MIIQPRLILFASTNRGKFGEVRAVCRRYDIIAVGPWELTAPGAEKYGIKSPLPPVDEVIEDAGTYTGNARKKAVALHHWSGLPTLGDDTGLEVFSLNGAPGIYTARYAGSKANPENNRRKLLEVLEKSSERAARFVCHLCFVPAPHQEHTAEGELRGSIAHEVSGGAGFGYDSLFLVDGQAGKTLATLKADEVEFETHRIAAIHKLFAKLGFKQTMKLT